jgi:hypothetical protein
MTPHLEKSPKANAAPFIAIDELQEDFMRFLCRAFLSSGLVFVCVCVCEYKIPTMYGHLESFDHDVTMKVGYDESSWQPTISLSVLLYVECHYIVPRRELPTYTYYSR